MTWSKRFWILLGLLALPAAAPADPPATNVEALIRDTQRMAPGNDRMSLAWWIPEDFWRVSLSQDKRMTAEGVEEILKVLRPYTLVAVADGTIGPMGGVTFKPESEIRGQLVLVDTSGKVHRPLAADAVSGDIKNLLGFMKPVLSNMLGPMGENLHFFAFPARNESGRALADPLSEGNFAIRIGEQSFEWRLPLGSLVPPKMCPRDKEIVNGAWSYCPWHGEKLVPASGS